MGEGLMPFDLPRIVGRLKSRDPEHIREVFHEYG